MDSMPPQLMSELSWQSPRTQNPAQISHQLSEQIRQSNGIGSQDVYDSTKMNSSEDNISSLFMTQPFSASFLGGLGNGVHPAGNEKSEFPAKSSSPNTHMVNHGTGESSPRVKDEHLAYSQADNTTANATHSVHESDDNKDSPDPYSDMSNKKRHRLRPDQTRYLMEIFEKTTKPDADMRRALGKKLSMTPRTVQIWFQNRRAKIKRESMTSLPLKMQNRYAPGTPDVRNRLTFSQAYMGRRQHGRIVSDGFGQQRSANIFGSYQPGGLYGLQLQNPSQISAPIDMTLQFPGSHYQDAAVHGFDQSAMGIPAGQHEADKGRREDLGPASYSAAAMNQQFNSVLPVGPHGHAIMPDYGHMRTGEHQLDIPHGYAMPTQSNIAPAALQPPSSHGTPSDRSARSRSFTTDSHTLSHLGQGMSGADHSMAGLNGGRYMLPGHGIGAEGQHREIQQPPRLSIPTDLPSADALLETRRRHLQDLIIINQTHAARGLSINSTSSGLSTDMPCGEEVANSSKPLLFSELSHPLATGSGSINAVAPISIGTGSLSNTSGIPSGQDVPAVTSVNSLYNNLNSHNTSFGVLSNQNNVGGVPEFSAVNRQASIDSSCSGGAFSSGAVAEHFGRLSRQNTAHDIASNASHIPDDSTTADSSQYHILRDLLLQCSPSGLLNNCEDVRQANRTIDEALFLSLTSSKADPSQNSTANSTIPNGLNDVGFNLAATSESRFGREIPAASGVATERSGGFPGSMFDSDFGGSYLSGSESASTGARDVDMHPLLSSAFTVTTSGNRGSPQPKPDPKSVVSVAPEEAMGQREIMIEQISFPSV
ncbi:hypothetical protein H4R24_001040 [Coemansia sp. RSA 988]|nr:hypothetical protein H4R24_001040 [Coemansia sp. RSA 988]